MTDDLMMRIEMRRGGTARGVVGSGMAPNVDIARILLRLAFPSFSRVQWTKTAEGFAFEALMPAAWLTPTSDDDARRVLDDPASAMFPPPAAPAAPAARARRPGGPGRGRRPKKS